MKLIVAIVQDQDTPTLIDELTEKEYRVTKLASTGGFLKSGNTTLLIGMEEHEMEDVMNILEKTCKSREAKPGVNVGGATIFVLDIDEFKRV